MKKLDFRNFSVPTGITRQTREVFDAREQIADLLYTRVSGIKAHRLAFKIFESTGETEFSDEETGMIHMAVERYCLPNVIDALNEILGNIILKGIYNHNEDLQNYEMASGDSVTVLITKADGFRYQILNHSS
jgi:hypothetical protein